ncbi:hypothetical protein [Guptibacillus algicola]|uniref:hypothetical protein n=1 Tax=Guptibacillus algicola TaxID=225844 RepID=UPI001CD327FB|nr:hypothetical protein [Alkalihalobacillus algicola]MCA0988638.1 hypothetical protein [Alkalihalobacillus algicola]
MTVLGMILWGSLALLVILAFVLEKIFGMKKPTKSDRQKNESVHIIDRANNNSGPPV